jgi:hypothetical protein
MKILSTLLLTTTVLSSIAVKAQTANEIVDKYVAALGGKEKVAAIKSLYTESTMQMMGQEIPSTTYILNGKGFKNEMDFNGTKMIQCVNKDGGWMVNPGQDPQPLPAEMTKSRRIQLDIGGPLFNYAAKGNKVELIGKEDVDKIKNAYKLKVTTPDSMTMTLFIDPSTYYLIKSISNVNAMGQDFEISSTYSDYRKTDYGYPIPYTTELTIPQGNLVLTTKKVEVNKDIDPKIFEMPK